MDKVSWLKVRQKMKKDMIKFRDKVKNMDVDLIDGYFLPIEEICLIPSTMEEGKHLLDAAVEVAGKYEQNARRVVLDEALGGLVAVWEDEVPGLADAIKKDRGFAVASFRQAAICLVEAIKEDGDKGGKKCP